uniref:Phosphatidylinositol glycan anchor biosynthesis, class F n=1 Tax=Cyprinus carpio TaxID=7962 RepID=A0A8C2D4D2_CYPCA
MWDVEIRGMASAHAIVASSIFMATVMPAVFVENFSRVFSRDGAMSVWDTSLQITTGCSVIGAWLGAFPIPLDWDRPWQVWPISCTLGATTGFLTGLLAAPVWIHWHRKQLTYKLK